MGTVSWRDSEKDMDDAGRVECCRVPLGLMRCPTTRGRAGSAALPCPVQAVLTELLKEPVPALKEHGMSVDVFVAKNLRGFPVRTDLFGILRADLEELAFADLGGREQVAVAVRVAVPGKILSLSVDRSEEPCRRENASGSAGTAGSADARIFARRRCGAELRFSGWNPGFSRKGTRGWARPLRSQELRPAMSLIWNN